MTTHANLKIAILSSLIILGGTAVWAKDGRHVGRSAERFSHMDADGDGALTQAEMKAYAEARFADADTDNDGFLSAEELEAAAAKRQSDRAGRMASRMMERMDANGDGKLEMNEMGRRHNPDEVFAKLDTDGNGALSAEEFAKAREHRGKHGRKHNKPASE